MLCQLSYAGLPAALPPGDHRLSQGVTWGGPGRSSRDRHGEPRPPAGGDMRTKATFLAGFATGYVLGSRAGRERYEQIRRSAKAVAASPAVQRVDHLGPAPGRRRAVRGAGTRPPGRSATGSTTSDRPGSAPAPTRARGGRGELGSRQQRARRHLTMTRLRRSDCGGPGIKRVRRGKGFTYQTRGRGQGHRPGDAAPHRRPRHPPGLGGRVDLPVADAGTSRRSAPTPPDAGSTATTTTGGSSATPRSTSACSPSPDVSPSRGPTSRRTCPSAA